MDSSMSAKPQPQGVPLSSTQSDMSLSSSSGSFSFPIRAPLTVDTDTSSNYSSDYNGAESEGSLSGDDENSRPFVEHPIEDETPEETSGDEDFLVSRPFEKDPDDEIVQGVSNGEKFVVSRPFGDDPKEGIVQATNEVEKFVVSRPLVVTPNRLVTKSMSFSRPIVANVDEETLVTPTEDELAVVTEARDDMLLSKHGMIPVAPLSRDSDDDSVGSLVEEDDKFSGVSRFSGVARVPSTGILGETSVPKVQVLGVEEEDDNTEDESQFEAVLESVVVKDSISEVVLDGVVGFDEAHDNIDRGAVEDSVSNGMVKHEGFDVEDVAKSMTLVETEASILLDSPLLGESSSEYAVEETQALTNVEQVTELHELNSLNPCCDLESSEIPGELAVDSINIHDNKVIGSDQVVDTGADEVKSEIDLSVDSPHLEVDKDVDSTNEADLVDAVVGLEASAVGTVEEKNVPEMSGEEFLKPSEDVSLKFDSQIYGTEETAQVYKTNNIDAACMNNQNCEYNVVEVNDSTVLSLGSGTEKIESSIEEETENFNLHLPISTEVENESSISDLTSLGSDQVEVQNNNEADCDLVEECSHTSNAVENLNFGEFDMVNCFTELEKPFSSASVSGGEISQDHSQRADGQIVTVSDEEVDIDGEKECKTLFDSAAHTALLNSAKGIGPDCGSVSFISASGAKIFSLDCRARESSAVSSMELELDRLISQLNHHNCPSSTEVNTEKDLCKEEEEEMNFEIQQIRVKFLRLVHRLGLSAEDTIAAQVLYRLDLALGMPSSPRFNVESAKRAAIECEAEENNEFDFFLNILIIGKSGVGKSATINSIFGREKVMVDPFEPSTTSVKEIMGTIDGINVRIIDTPGLETFLIDQSINKKILKSIKRITRKYPPDVVIYADRLDIEARDLNDLPMLRSITSTFGSSVWHQSIITLTHAASAPPDGPSGSPLSYEMFVAQRSHVVQQLISQAVGYPHKIQAGSTIPVCPVENRQTYERMLPNGETWRPHLLLMCYSVKILSEAKSIVEAQAPSNRSKLLGFSRIPIPRLPYFLSSLLQPLPLLKLKADHDEENDIELLEDGMTFEKHVAIGEQLDLVGRCGIIKSHGNKGCGAKVDVRSKETDDPFGKNRKTASFSLMRCGVELIWDCNMQSDISIRRNNRLDFSAGLNSKGYGGISVKASGSDQLLIALLGFLPISCFIFRKLYMVLGEKGN